MFSFLLIPVSWLYGALMSVRNWCYDYRIFHIEHSSVPVISVGNMTTGGTGKTPFVEYLLREFMNSDRRVAVISRGYKRRSKGTVVVSDGRAILADAANAGDEAFQTARKFPNVVVIVDERRPRAAALAVAKYHTEVIILDDGFQHRSLARDLDIIMIDGRMPLEKIHLLPSGMRREALSGLRRGDIVVTSEEYRAKTEQNLLPLCDAPVISVRQSPVKFVRLFGIGEATPQSMLGRACTAVCGIGNPGAFRKTLQDLGMNIGQFIAFDDHHRYTTQDLDALHTMVGMSPAKLMVTTEKDAVKLQSAVIPPGVDAQEWYYLEIEAELVEGGKALRDRLDALFRKAA